MTKLFKLFIIITIFINIYSCTNLPLGERTLDLRDFVEDDDVDNGIIKPGGEIIPQYPDSIDDPKEEVLGVPLESIVKVFPGYNTTIALSENGNAYAWANKYHWQLGNGGNQFSEIPKLIKMPHGETLKYILQDINKVFGISNKNELYVWGQESSLFIPQKNGLNDDNKLIPTKIQNIADVKEIYPIYDRGYIISLLIRTNSNQLYGLGNNKEAQLAQVGISHLYTPTLINGISGIEKIYIDGYSVYAVTTNGFYVWGRNNVGQLTIPSPSRVSTPTPANSLIKGKITNIIFDNYKSFFQTDIKNFYCVNHRNQNIFEEIKIPNEEIIQIETNYNSDIVVTKSGNVYARGTNESGHFGDGSTENYKYENFTKLKNFSNIKKIYTSYNKTNTGLAINTTLFAIDNQGYIYSSGSNYYKILGRKINTDNDILSEKLKGPVSVNKLFILNNGDTVAAYTGDNQLFGWGQDSPIYGIPSTNTFVYEPRKPELTQNIKNIVELYNYDNTGFLFDGNYLYSSGINMTGTGLDHDKFTYIHFGKFNGNNLKIKSIQYQFRNFYIITENNQLFVFGNNGNGATGNNSNKAQDKVYRVKYKAAEQ